MWATPEAKQGGAPLAQLCSALLALCLSGGQPEAARTLAVAAASIVNKAPAGGQLALSMARHSGISEGWPAPAQNAEVV